MGGEDIHGIDGRWLRWMRRRDIKGRRMRKEGGSLFFILAMEDFIRERMWRRRRERMERKMRQIKLRFIREC